MASITIGSDFRAQENKICHCIYQISDSGYPLIWGKKWGIFQGVMYGFESWTIRKAEHWRTVALELWCWRRLLRFPWHTRRSNHSVPKEINPEYLFEGLMLNLKLQLFGHTMRRSDSLEKTLMLWKIEGWRRRGQQRMGWLEGISNSMDMSLSKVREFVIDREPWRSVVHGMAKSRTWLRDRTELNQLLIHE